ncbi:MAG: hypothetical protein GX786_04475 [Clostridiales bacterium]|nr:hypothetical protein [Clostridiales bacterium]
MQNITDFFKQLTNISFLTDFLIYAAIGIITLIGLIKCILPVWRRSKLLNSGIKKLEKASPGEKPPWQEVKFLGSAFQSDWHRFLVNAEQLELRGLNCDVQEYINDETVVHSPGNSQLAELIPSLLTSLGILGTFIGLMRGLSGLDMTNVSRIMEGIPSMIEGMKFAFATSVAGIACSLGFNMLHRVTIGNAYKRIDRFAQTFSRFAMQRPVDHEVQLIIQNQDQGVMIRQASEELSARMSTSIEGAISRVMQPITVSMDNFIVGATREQIDGVHRIVHSFIDQMNQSLDGQFLQLGKTISQVNQAQHLSYEQLNQSMITAGEIVAEVEKMQRVSTNVMEHFEAYVLSLEEGKEQGRKIELQREEIFRKIQETSHEQTMQLQQLRGYQAKLETALQEFSIWSDRNITGIEKHTMKTHQDLLSVSENINENGQMLAKSYTTFVENVTEGLGRALGMFDENIHQVLGQLNRSLEDIQLVVETVPTKMDTKQKEYDHQVQGYITALSSLQQSLTEIASSFKSAMIGTGNKEQKNTGKKNAEKVHIEEGP